MQRAELGSLFRHGVGKRRMGQRVHMTWAAPQGKKACRGLGRRYLGLPESWGKGSWLAIAQTPSLELLLLQALGPIPWAHTRRAGQGTLVTPEGYT